MAAHHDGRRILRRCGFVAMFCLLVGAAPAAREFRTIEAESLKITIDSDWGPKTAPGYVPVRFDIANTGDARVIEFIGSGSRSFRASPRSFGAEQSVRQTVRLARGDRVRLTIPVPVFADNEMIWFEVREDNRTIARFNYQSFQSRVLPDDASTLIVAESGSAFATTATKVVRTYTRTSGIVVSGLATATGGRISGSPSGVPPLDFLLAPERLPATWLGFTSLRAVVVGPDEWAQLNDAQRGALLTWTASGGDLILVNGNLAAVLPSLHGQPEEDPVRVAARYFFGRVQVLSSASFASTDLAHLIGATDTRDGRWALPANTALDWGTMETRGFRLRIPGVEGVPARAFLAILVLFTLLIGPANYWWLWRKRRLVLLVLTAPLISAVFIILLTGYAIAGEGFGVKGRAVTFTMLDQASKQAVTRASASLYAAGLSPSGGLRFGRDVAVFPLGQDGNGARETMNLNLTDAQHFALGLLQVRSATNFDEVTYRPARERLTFSHDSAGVTVVNGLEASIAQLIYREGDVLYRLSSALAPGAQRVLASAAFDGQHAPSVGMAIPAKFLDLVQHLPDGSYLALLDSSPFWDSGVSHLAEQGSVHLVHGWPEGQR